MSRAAHTVDGISYTVIRSGRRTMAIEISRDAQVLVRVPFCVTEQEITRFVDQHTRWIRTHYDRRLQQPKRPLSAAQIAELKQRAKAYLPERVVHFSRLMGLVPTGITINAARTRFGSCGTTNRLNFSCLLMLYPPEAIDYVVVHELAHLRYRHHQTAFYALIEQYLPDYRLREQMLKEMRDFDDGVD